jgi:hypothetical protein
MSRYNTGSAATLDDTANALLLRADLHIAFDKPRIYLVLKPATDGSMRRVVGVLINIIGYPVYHGIYKTVQFA